MKQSRQCGAGHTACVQHCDSTVLSKPCKSRDGGPLSGSIKVPEACCAHGRGQGLVGCFVIFSARSYGPCKGHTSH
jgi:hypothetical protein